jgi:hypothetical protein
MPNFEQTFFNYFTTLKRQILTQPLVLGGYTGSGGGSGGPPGGFLGSLPQYRISYDLSELESDFTPTVSGSLLDNLNRIRYRVHVLEESGPTGSGSISLYQNDAMIASGVTKLNFEGGVTVVDEGSNKTTVTITGGGGITEAPVDGKLYGRKNSGWQQVTTSGGQLAGFQVLTDEPNISWDLSFGNGRATLSGDRNLNNPTNMWAGEHYFLSLVQDSVTGGRTLSYGNAYKFSSNIHPILSSYKGREDILTFECDGNYMLNTGIVLNVTNIDSLYMTNMKLWLSADWGVYLDNGVTLCADTDTVYKWEDQSGSNNHVLQTTAGNRPQYRTSILGGRPVIRFNGTDRDFILSALDAGDNCSFFIVAIPSSTTPLALFDSSGNSNIPPIRNDPAGNWECYSNQPATDITLPDTNPVILEFLHTQSSGRSIAYYKNGILISTNTDIITDSYIWDIPRIGSVNQGGEGWYSGDIAEFIIYSEVLSATHRQEVENYLKDKYGIS